MRVFFSENKTTSLNIEVDISIQPATNYEISLMKKILENEDIQLSANTTDEVPVYHALHSTIFGILLKACKWQIAKYSLIASGLWEGSEKSSPSSC